MTHSFRAHYYHLVWSTKNRLPWITAEVQTELYLYFGGFLKNKGASLMEVNGISDHVHLLFEMSIPDYFTGLVRDLKASSCSLLRRRFSLNGFSWQEGYGSFSVSRSGVDRVRTYIRNQEKHHALMSFEEEYKRFLSRHEFEYDERFVLG